MKAFIAGVITLALLSIIITLGSIFITRRTDRMLSEIIALPESAVTADTGELCRIWDTSRLWFVLTVHREDVDSIDDNIEKLKVYIKEGNETGYLIALKELECLTERLKTAESFSLERIF